MAPITWQQARHLVVVDPDSGLEIPHVKGTDPAKGWIETYTTTACAPFDGMEMLMITKGPDGSEVTKKLHYTFVNMRDPATGVRWYLSAKHYCRYDLVNRYNGEVIFEVAGDPAPLRVKEPWTVAAEIQAILR